MKEDEELRWKERGSNVPKKQKKTLQASCVLKFWVNKPNIVKTRFKIETTVGNLFAPLSKAKIPRTEIGRYKENLG